MTQNLKTVAPFTMDTITGIIAGPRDYIASDSYRRRLAQISEGRDPMGSSDLAMDDEQNDPFMSVLRSIHADWSAWQTRRDFASLVDFDEGAWTEYDAAGH